MTERSSEHDGIYRIAFENAGDAIFIHRLDGTLLDVNRVACERLGYSREEILGMKLSDIDAPEYTMLIPQRTEALRQQGRLVIESHHRRKDGSTIPVEVNACTIDYDGGETVVLSIARDVTERTRLIEALRQEYDLITTLLDTVDALVVVLDLAGRIALFNRTAEEIMEYTFADVEGRLFWDLFRAPEDIQTVRETFIALRNGLPIREYENVWVTKNGESRLISWSNTALRDEKGAVEYVVATGVDVTELRASEAALRESRQFLESTMNALSAEMAILDEEGTIISVNRAWREFADRNDLAWDDYGVGRNYLTITDAAQGSGAEGAERAAQAIRDVIQRRQTEFYLEYPCHATWQQRWFAMRLSRFESESGIRVVVMHENITSQKLVEQALRRSEALFRGVVEQSPDGIVLTDEKGRIIEWNRGQERITQITAREVLGRPLWEVQEALLRGEEGTGAGPEELLRHFLAEGEALDDFHSTEQRLEQPDGNRRVLQSVLFPIKTEQGFMLGTISHDVTERKKAEEIVRESERRLDMMLQTMVDGVVLVDTEGQITYANPAAERILEVNREEVVARLYHSRQWRQIDETGADFVPEALPLSIALAKRQRVEGLEHGIEMPDGRVKWLSVNAAPLLDEEGELYGAVASFRDVTERKQTREALAWESAVNATMAEFARALISQANLEEISYLVLEKAKEFTDSQFGFVGYIDEESGSLVSASMTRDIWDNCQVAGKTVVFHKFSGLWGWVLQNRQPIIVNNPSDDPRSTGIPEGHIPIRRFLSAPALLGDRLVGQIALSNPNRDYVERDLELIERLASLYALAVERHRAETALRKYADEQATLYAITAAATRLQEPERLLTDVLDHVLSMLGAPTGWVTVPDVDNRPRLVATQGLPDTLCERELIGEMDECPIYRPHTHEPEKCSPMLASDCPEIAQTPLWGSETRHICIPLRTADRILGVLTVMWHQPEGRTDLGEDLLIAIGQQVGIALYNAQLYKAARQVDRLNVLNELDAALTATLDPEEVIEITLRQLTKALQAPEGTLLLCENAAGECLGRTVQQGQMLSLPASGSELAWLYPIKDFIAEELPLTPLLTAEIKEHLPDKAIPSEKWQEGDLLAPMWNDEGLVGVLILDERRTEKAYTSEDLALVQASVSRARQALQNARLYQASREQSARLATLNEISNVAVSSLDPDIVLRQILNLSCQALDAVEGSILLRQNDSEELTFAIIFGEDEEKLVGRTLKPGQGIASWALQHDEAILINDVSSDPRFYEGIDELTGFQTQSLICAPLRHRGEVIGIIEIVNKRRDDFTFQDLSLLEAIASVTAVALENARLYTKTQARAEELAMLNEIGLTLTSSLNSSAVVQNALELIRRLFQADAVSLLQPDPETRELFFVRALLGGQSKEFSQRLSAGEGLAGWSLTHRQPVLVEDAQRDPRYWSGGERELDYTPHAVMVVPLLIEGEAIGIIIVGSRTVGAFTPEDLQTLQALSSTLGVALENARLYEDLKRLLQERERAQAQLVHTEKMAALGRLIASLAHEINNPLQAVQGCLTLADEELMEARFERDALQRYIDIADKEIDRISVILRRMRDFYRPARHQMETTDIHQVLASVLALTNKQLQHSGVSVERDYMEKIPVLWANPDHLKQVFLNLILNAIDAMPDGGSLTVRTGVDTLHREEGGVPALRIDLADTGEGMDADTVSRLFEPFFTTKEDGTGLGLSISYGIIRAHEGEIEVKSQPGEGTTFSIRLPIEKGAQS